jgi:hypothetical protein
MGGGIQGVRKIKVNLAFVIFWGAVLAIYTAILSWLIW